MNCLVIQAPAALRSSIQLLQSILCWTLLWNPHDIPETQHFIREEMSELWDPDLASLYNMGAGSRCSFAAADLWLPRHWTLQLAWSKTCSLLERDQSRWKHYWNQIKFSHNDNDAKGWIILLTELKCFRIWKPPWKEFMLAECRSIHIDQIW